MKNSNKTIGNRTRDLPACSVVPQLTAPPRAPVVVVVVVVSVPRVIPTWKRSVFLMGNL